NDHPSFSGICRIGDIQFSAMGMVPIHYFDSISPGQNLDVLYSNWQPGDREAFEMHLNRVYAFNAERPNIGSCEIGTATELRPDASNLPEVLNTLSQDSHRYERFMALVASVLPGFHWVSIAIGKDHNNFLAKYWLRPASEERPELSVPFSKCGTG